MSRRARATCLGLLASVHLLALSCAPYLSDQAPSVRHDLSAWQCPTPSPIPTYVVGYENVYGGGPYPAPTTHRAEPIYATPVPTVTPYIRTGSDFYFRQRVPVGPLLITTEAADDDDVLVTLTNRANQPVELHLQLSLVRTARRADGRLVEGSWSPSSDGPGVIAAQATERVRLDFPTIAGVPQEWGMPFVNDGQRRNGQAGSGYRWWRNADDPLCAGKAGGPATDAYDVPHAGGDPAFGRAGWPVPAGATISRGYGCHAYWTGVRGAGCPASAPWFHNGVDFACTACPAYAVRPLEIAFAGSVGDCAGTFIRARDDDGYTFDYYHLAAVAVAAGDRVAAGQPIGDVGTTGCSTGVHLHLTVRAPDGREINPFNVLQQQ